jgi:hypothetical protein
MNRDSCSRENGEYRRRREWSCHSSGVYDRCVTLDELRAIRYPISKLVLPKAIILMRFNVKQTHVPNDDNIAMLHHESALEMSRVFQHGIETPRMKMRNGFRD